VELYNIFGISASIHPPKPDPSTQILLVPVQNRCLPDAEGAAGVGPLTPRVPQALSGLASHQHRGDVVDLVRRLGAGALLRLGDAAALTPAAAGVEDQDQEQDGQQKGDHPALGGEEGDIWRRGGEERERDRRVKGENRLRESCQVGYGSKSKQRCQQ